jgi:hypothetical protein
MVSRKLLLENKHGLRESYLSSMMSSLIIYNKQYKWFGCDIYYCFSCYFLK